MKNAFFILLLVVLSASAFAQGVERQSINGTIVAPGANQIEGVHIYNVSSHKGVVTDSEGGFVMDVAINDRLQVTCLQYASFTLVVLKGVLDKKAVTITLNPMITELDEVVIKTYNLSGDIAIDVAKIKTSSNFKDFDTAYETLEFQYEFAPDAATSLIGNSAKDAYYSGQYREGANLIGGVNLLTRLIFTNPVTPKTTDEKLKQNVQSYRTLSEKFENEFITAHYKIPSDNVADFVYFVHESDFDESYLESNNELLLLNYMIEKSEEYLNKFEKQ